MYESGWFGLVISLGIFHTLGLQIANLIGNMRSGEHPFCFLGRPKSIIIKIL